MGHDENENEMMMMIVVVVVVGMGLKTDNLPSIHSHAHESDFSHHDAK